MMVFIVSIFDVIVWVTRFFPDKQYNYIKRRLQLMKRDTDFNSQPSEYVKRWYKEFIFGYLEPDGIFMLRLLSSNTSDFVCTEVINHLWQAFYNRDVKNLKRKRKIEITDDENNNEEIKDKISDPVDLSQNNESIRRRSSHLLPIPTPKNSTSSIERVNHAYGTLAVSNQNYRSSLTTGKQSSLSTLIEGDV